MIDTPKSKDMRVTKIETHDSIFQDGLRFARKVSDIAGYAKQLEAVKREFGHEPYTERCKVMETITVTSEEFADLLDDFFKDRDYLKGKGGWINDGRAPHTSTRKVIEVTNGAVSIFVDPQGSDCARYVAKAPAKEAKKVTSIFFS